MLNHPSTLAMALLVLVSISAATLGAAVLVPYYCVPQIVAGPERGTATVCLLGGALVIVLCARAMVRVGWPRWIAAFRAWRAGR